MVLGGLQSAPPAALPRLKAGILKDLQPSLLPTYFRGATIFRKLCSSFELQGTGCLHVLILLGRTQAQRDKVEAEVRSAPWAKGVLGMAPGSRRILQRAPGPTGSPQVLHKMLCSPDVCKAQSRR